MDDPDRGSSRFKDWSFRSRCQPMIPEDIAWREMNGKPEEWAQKISQKKKLIFFLILF